MSGAQPKKYLNTRSVCQRYDRKDRSWLHRERKRNPSFPAPDIIMNGRALWDEAKLDAYDEKLRAEGKS